MALLPAGELLRAADAGGYAVGAFNFSNLELLQAIISAAEAERAPVIIQASQSGLAYAGVEYVAAIGRLAAQRASVPVALNLDHGRDWARIMACLRHGFTGVMVDGSHLPWAENVALVKRVVEVARAMGVSVEAELGRIVGTEDYIKVEQKEELFTDPAEAARFVAETGVDALAVAVGTAHGV
ncbi:MAG: class II fructose-bisphosphate aldolase, partial [Bacillota bacterium]|nr:class II fructose-bisphosphate aldolase [Bacillota bacterium]